jgi:hypothetical protein
VSEVPSWYAIVGGLVLFLLALISVPLVVFLTSFVGVKIVLALLAYNYWTAFWWSCLYALFPLTISIVRAIKE